MNDWRSWPGSRHDVITVRVIWAAFALSLLVHIGALWISPPLMRALTLENSELTEPTRSLVARLAPRSSPSESSPPAAPPSPPPQASSPPQRRAPRATPAVPSSPTPPQFARNEPAPGSARTLPVPPADAPPAARPPVETDLSSYIAARRFARGESAAAASQGSEPNTPPAEDEKERRNRVVAANLGLNRTPTFGDDPKRGGGLFQIRRMGYDDAEFYFNGWDQDIGRNARQLIEVRKGANSDIRVAVIRKIIEIIRSHEPGDFVWVSRRFGRQIALSARPGDNATLEDFMMREFFGDGRPP